MNAGNPRLLAVLAVALLAPLAFLVALRAFTYDELEGVTFDPKPLVVSPTPREVRDRQGVTVLLTWDEGPVVRAPAWHGTVTAVYVAPGQELASGQRVLSIDGVDRVAWAAPSPFYRPLSSQMEGPDVAMLHEFLLAMEFISVLPPDPQFLYFASSLAVEDFNESIGAGPSRVFDPATLIWLPLTPFPAATVEFELGAPAPGRGATLATSPATLVGATLQPIQPDRPISLEPGVPYVLIKGEARLEFERDSLTLAGDALAEFAALVDPLTEQSDASIERETPLQTLSVPATAITANSSGGLCAWVVDASNGEGFRVVAVTLAGSSVGVTNVATGLAATDQVLANPSDVLADPQCPSN